MKTPEGSIVAIDFSKIELVTASFFRTSFKAFRDHCRSATNLYPVFVNSKSATLEEVQFLTDSSNDAFVFATLSPNGELSAPHVLGRLDAKQDFALASVVELGEADAGELLEKFPEDPQPKSSTTWSNRLSTLVDKGILMERLEGRIKKFRPVIKGLTHGR
jgi:hypothetical protein